MANINNTTSKIFGTTMMIIMLFWTICLMSSNTMAHITRNDKTVSGSINTGSSNYPTDSEIILDNLSKSPSPYSSVIPVTRDGTNNEFDSSSSSSSSSLENRLFLNRLFNMFERKRVPPQWIIHQALLSGQQKRQIRYQQCYFNPISCF